MSFKFAGRLAAMGALVVVAAASQATYLVSHHLEDMPPVSFNSVLLFNIDASSNVDVTGVFTVDGNSLNYSFDSSPFGGPAVSTTILGLFGTSDVVVGMNAGDAIAADLLDLTFESVFTLYTEVQVAGFINDFVGGGAPAAAAEVALEAFVAANIARFNPVGVDGSVVQFSGAQPLGRYSATQVPQGLESVPEPATMILAAAAAGIGAVRQRRRKLARA